MAIALLILLLLFLLWPTIMRWLRGYMSRKAEDYLRRMSGMPPREKNSRKSRTSTSGSTAGSESRRGRAATHDDDPIIPREYAEDVEFVEVKEYSESVSIGEDSSGVSYTVESQVSDVEYREIKTSK